MIVDGSYDLPCKSDMSGESMDFSLRVSTAGRNLKNPEGLLDQWSRELKINLHTYTTESHFDSSQQTLTRPSITFHFQTDDLEKGVEGLDVLRGKMLVLHKNEPITDRAFIDGIERKFYLEKIVFPLHRGVCEVERVISNDRRKPTRKELRVLSILSKARTLTR